MSDPTTPHARTNELGRRYLRDEKRCRPVLIEPLGINRFVFGEIVDVWGLVTGIETHLIESKLSVPDWIKDRDKPFRKDGRRGAGRHRWFLCEHGLIEPHEVEDRCPGWGLLTHRDFANVTVALEAPAWQQRNWPLEMELLARAVNNFESAGGRDAGDVRPGKRNDLTADQRNAIKSYVEQHGEAALNEVLRASFGRASTKMRTAVIRAIESRQIEGVTARGIPTVLVKSS